LGFLGKGNSSLPGPLEEQIRAGACGLKLHEDWGTTPAAIDCCLSVADDYDVQVAIHTDTLNESGFVEDTIAAIKGRAIHTWHTAHKMKTQFGYLPQDSPRNDNFRAKRYVAKYTIGPAVTHGIAGHVGSIEAGKFADLVLWKPAFFGVKPELVLKGGMIAYAQMGDANASIPTPEPVYPRPMFASFGRAATLCSLTFVSKAAVHENVPER